MLFTHVLFVSCSQEEYDLDLLTEESSNKTPLSGETLKFKNSLVSTLKEQKVQTKGSKKFEFSKKQVKDLTQQSLEMFKSHGFKESEFKEFMGEGDERMIFMGVMFTGWMESGSTNASARIKTRSESDVVCTDTSPSLTDCLLRATGLQVVVDAFVGKCLTKTAMLRLLRKTCAKYIPYVGIAIAVADFTSCMDWI